MTGIVIFFVMLIGGAGGTYLFLLDQPVSTPKPLTKVQQPSKSKQFHPEKVSSQVQAQATTKEFPISSLHSAEKIVVESGSSIVHASTVSVATPTKIKVAGKAFEAEKGKEEKLALADLQFGLSRTSLRAQTKATLDTYAKKLRDPQWSVLIQGHTDETGSIRKNFHVGLRRANAVKQYLITKGISKDRLHPVSLGEYQPVCMDRTSACQLQNRRVSFAVARRERIEMPNVVPVKQEKRALSEKNKMLIELVSLPEIYESTFDNSEKVDLIYPSPVHSTPPPSGVN